MCLYIDEATVCGLFDMDQALKLTEEAFRLFSLGEAFNTVRTRARIRKGALHLLPAAVPTLNIIGYKAYTSFKTGTVFRIFLHDATTGELLCIMDASEIGRLRTGAASGIATKYLGDPGKNFSVIFGTGYQAESQLEAIHKIYPQRRVEVISRNPLHAVSFAARMSEKLNTEVCSCQNIREALEEADIITTITTAAVPLFDKSFRLKENVHINAAGSNSLIRREIPESVVENAFVVVDSKEVAEKECGDILPSLEKGRLHFNEITELGDIITGKITVPSDPCRTLFESQGMGLQDILCAAQVYLKASEQNLGQKLPI